MYNISQEMIDEFTLDSDAIKDVAASFRYDIEHGVKETGESSLVGTCASR